MTRRDPNRIKAHGLVILTLVLITHQVASAVLLDWNAVDWPTGALSQHFDIDPANPGPDVTIAISGATNNFPDPVDDTTSLNGGFGPAEESLFLVPDFASTNQFLTVTVTFLYPQGVNDVWFDLFDIDKATAADYLHDIHGSVGVLQLPASVTTPASPSYLVTGNGTLTLALTGTAASPNVNTGNATLSFGNTALTSFSFTFQVIHPTADPPSHGIALHEINFVPLNPPTLTIQKVSSEVTLCWNSYTNKRYQLQHSDDLATNSWVNWGSPIMGNGTTNCVTDAIGGFGKFYRVSALP